jgi:hypothetical protein
MPPEPPAAPGARGAASRFTPSAAALAALIAGSIAWGWLSRTVFYAGPSEWDDVMYLERAALPGAQWEIRNRYVHVWTLRLFQLALPTRELAGSTYATLVVIGLGWLAFAFGRRLGGLGTGLLAAALVPLHPALLRQLTSPMVDPPMVFWSMLGLACAVMCTEAQRPARALALALASGIACYFAAKTKETGLAVVPAVAWVLASDRRALAVRLSACLGGAIVGWLVLVAFDHAFLPRGGDWRPADWGAYLRARPGTSGLTDLLSTARSGATERGDQMRRDFVEQLLTMPLLPFTLMGVAGALRTRARGTPGARAAQALAAWLAASLVLSSMVAWRFRGIDAEARYCAVMGAPLAVLGADWLVATWQRTTAPDARHTPPAVAALLVSIMATASVAFVVVAASDVAPGRAVFFGAPVAIVLLTLVPWATGERVATRGAVASLLLLVGGIGVAGEVHRTADVRARMAPWRALALAADAAGANVVAWKPPRDHKGQRLERRLRAFSRRPADAIQARSIGDVSRARSGEWVLTRAAYGDSLARTGWSRVTGSGEGEDAWVVYRQRDR